MKAATIHVNEFGDLINPTSAVGFRLEDDNGMWIEARIVEGKLTLDGIYALANFGANAQCTA